MTCTWIRCHIPFNLSLAFSVTLHGKSSFISLSEEDTHTLSPVNHSSSVYLLPKLITNYRESDESIEFLTPNTKEPVYSLSIIRLNLGAYKLDCIWGLGSILVFVVSLFAEWLAINFDRWIWLFQASFCRTLYARAFAFKIRNEKKKRSRNLKNSY